MMQLINSKVEDVLSLSLPRSFRCSFADPPDNIGLEYNSFDDRQDSGKYIEWLGNIISESVRVADVSWFSYNAKHTFQVGRVIANMLDKCPKLKARSLVQIFTFGRYAARDFCNNHRPLVRLMWDDVTLYPDAIRVPSWRQLHGDKRANPRGRVPGDVFDFPRVTGNSRQRRPWHPTQLHEGLVERCLKMSCVPGDKVLDLFSGTGTTMRVCKRLELSCLSVECDLLYCQKIAEENGLYRISVKEWQND